MSNPSLLLRSGPSGPTFAPSTPGYVLTVASDGQHIVPAPGGGGGSTDIGTLTAAGFGANQYPLWNGTHFLPATPLPSPANPADNNKLPVATNGSYSYAFLSDANVDPAAAIAGTKISAQFGAQFVSIGVAPLPAVGNLRVQHGFSAIGWSPGAGQPRSMWDWGVSSADTFTVGAATTAVVISCINNLRLLINGSANLTVLPDGPVWGGAVTQMRFTAPSAIGIADGLGGAGNLMTYKSQDQTAGVGSGGDAIFRSGGGFGGGASGVGHLRAGLATDQFLWSDTGIGFFGTAPAAKPTITGSRAANPALASLLTLLAGLGLIVDGTTV